MQFRDKVEAFLQEAEAEGIPRWNLAPPVYRLFWWLGLEIPPPLFLRRWLVVLFEGVFFALMFSLWFFQFFLVAEAFVCAALTGLMYGVVAGLQHYDLRRLLRRVPSWDRYIPGISEITFLW